MTAIHRVVLMSMLIAAAIPASVAGQASSSDSLIHRINLLERQVADLEQRVRELEAIIKVEPARDRAVPASANWRDLANWRRLRREMTMDQVRSVLGEPERVDAIGAYTYWYWGRPVPLASLHFDGAKLAGWSEPRR